MMAYIKQLLQKLNLEDTLSHALVHTAECNSRATRYVRNEKGIPNPWVKIGVKNAHDVVLRYDIAANSEPNGHACLYYNKDRVDAVLAGNDSIEAKKLKAFLEISNIVIGDSLSNFLLLEGLLYDLDVSV